MLGLAACLAASLISPAIWRSALRPRSLSGSACGMVNGVLVTYGRIPSFIATYGMLWIAHGIGYIFMKGEVIYGLPRSFRFIGAGFLWGIPVAGARRGGTPGGPALLLHHDRARPRALRHRWQCDGRAAVRHAGRATPDHGLRA